MVKNLPDKAGDVGSIPGLGRSPGEGMVTHSSILAWRILWIENPGGYSPSGHKESKTTEPVCAHAHTHTYTHPHAPTHSIEMTN